MPLQRQIQSRVIRPKVWPQAEPRYSEYKQCPTACPLPPQFPFSTFFRRIVLAMSKLETHDISSLRLRNAGLPVARLADDVLLDIFKKYRAFCFGDCTLFFDHMHGARRQLSRYAWLHVSRVCYHWRTIVVKAPSMWNEIYLSWDPRHVKHMLTRSAQVPLVIRADQGLPQAAALVPLLMPELHRMRHLELTVPEPLVEAFLQACGTSSAPNLTLLRLGFLGTHRCWDGPYHDEDSKTEIQASGILTKARAPNLRSFSLVSSSGISIRSISLPRTLQELTLVQHARRPRQTAELFSVLATLPNLRFLHLERLLPVEPPMSPVRLTLPALVSLSLEDSLPCFAYFLGSVRTPVIRQVTLNSVNGAPESSILPKLANVLRARLHDGGTEPIFSNFEYGESSLTNFIRLELHSYAGDDIDRSLTVKFEYCAEDACLIPAFVGSLPLGAVTMCEVSLNNKHPSMVERPDDNYAAWRTSFCSLKLLEDLMIDCDRWLFADKNHLGSDNLRRFFPTLKCLQVNNKLVWSESG